MTDDAEAGRLEYDTLDRTVNEWMAIVATDPPCNRFSVDEAPATFASAGFVRVPKKRSPWGDQLPGTNRPCARFERHGVPVLGLPLGHEVVAPGDGSLLTCFPDAERAIRFVRAFGREPEPMAADGFGAERFGRGQGLARALLVQVLHEAKAEARATELRAWMGPEAANGTAPEGADA
jgi:hypothetical protein